MGRPSHLPLPGTAKHVFLFAPLFHFNVNIAKKKSDTVELLIHQSSVNKYATTSEKFYFCVLKETITILQQAKLF